MATGSGGTLCGLAIANYLTGSKLRQEVCCVCVFVCFSFLFFFFFLSLSLSLSQDVLASPGIIYSEPEQSCSCGCCLAMS